MYSPTIENPFTRMLRLLEGVWQDGIPRESLFIIFRYCSDLLVITMKKSWNKLRDSINKGAPILHFSN